jgi:hypothetical protein
MQIIEVQMNLLHISSLNADNRGIDELTTNQFMNAGKKDTGELTIDQFMNADKTNTYELTTDQFTDTYTV